MSALLMLSSIAQIIARGNYQNDDGLQMQQDTYSLYESYSDVLWTRTSFPMESQPSSGSGFGGEQSAAHMMWEWNYPPNQFALGLGHSGRKLVTGVVKDGLGNPTSATVQLFNTTTGSLVDTQTSDPTSGVYKCGDPNAVTCFSVGYKTGTPDTEGTTVNTLTGT